MKIEKLPVPPTMLGEGPHWDSRRQTLYYISIFERTINRYVPATKEYASTKIVTENFVSFVIPIDGAGDLFLVNDGHAIRVLRWDGQSGSKTEFVQMIAELDLENPKNCINDAKVDPRGRLFTGTIGIGVPEPHEEIKCIPTGSFYSITGHGIVQKHYTGVTTSNGIAYDLRRKALYHVDTFANCIRRFDYDVDAGNISNKSIVFDYKEANVPGYPDGMTIDTDGNLWVASYEGSSVLNISPDTGKVIRTLDIPDKLVTSVTFGGPNLDVLYVTTGYPKTTVGEPKAGYTYVVTGLGVRGFENLPFDCKILKT